MLPAFLLTSLGRAQTADVHGPVAPTPTGDPADPLLLWAPPTGAKGEWALTLGGQAVDDPAVLYRVEGDEVTELPLVDLAVGVDLGARWSPIGPLALALTLPVFPVVVGDADTDGVRESGPALGDARLAVPISLVARRDREGFGLGLVPYVELPTGAERRFLGEPEPALGALVAAGLRTAGFALDANVGLEKVARVDRGAQVRGPLALPVGLSAGVHVAEPVWARIEARGGFDLLGGVDPAVAPDEVATPGVPFEVLATATARFGRTTAWVGGGRGVTDGIGAANVRVLGGVGYAHLVVPRDVVADDDAFVFRVVDARGVPVDGVDVLVGGELVGRTDAAGELAVPDVRWSKGVELRAPRFVPTRVEKPADPAAARLETVLPWQPAKVEAAVVDVEGHPLDATVTASSLDDPSRPPVSGKPGEVELVPGRYRIEVTAPGMGTQVREIEVEPTGRPPEPLEAVLLADQGGPAGTAVVVTDPEGRPVEGARVLIDGLLVGTTAAGGLVELAGLSSGTHTVEVQHEAFTASEPVQVALTEGTLQVPVPLQRVPGSVRVVVRGPNGVPVSDAVARFVGPRRLAPMALGEDGDRVQVLGPGEWTLVVTSGRYGVQEREVVVPEGRYELITVEIVLQPDEAGEAELVLRVVGPDGAPVEGVEVALDDRPLGATSTGGTLSLAGLAPGPRDLVLRADGLRPLEPVSIVLVPGIQERLQTVEWKEGTVDVVVRGPSGPVPDARVRFTGDDELPPTAIGPTGRARLSVPPGTWTAQVSSEALGVQERDLVVPEGSDLLQTVEFVLSPIEGGLAELSVRVVDPEGRPVSGARVALDGEDVGTTANAGTLGLDQLTMGRREVTVAAAPYRAASAQVRLLEGEQDVEIPLDWGPGAVRVRVRSGDEPVPDAVVRLLGDDVRPPIPVDPASGEVLTQVPPGLWLVLASSPTLGIAEWDLEVKPEPGLNEVTLDMRPTATDRTDLVVRVIDPDGQAVEQAKVTIDGASAGETQQGGVVLSRGLVPGAVQVRVEAPDYVASAPVAVELVPGLVERVIQLKWVEVPVPVRTIDADGARVDAVVQWIGPGDVDEVRSGPQGIGEAMLRPGQWRVIATSADGELAADAALTVRLADEPRPLELVLKPTRAVLAGEEVLLREMVQFDFDRATLRPDSGPVLDEIARVLLALPDVVRLEVQGHTDTVGALPVNQALSQARAEAVVAALVARGVPPEKLVARGYGPTRPIDANDTDEGRARNRRVQFEIVERAARG